MIKINLLPRKVTRKKMTVIRHLVLGGVLILAVTAMIGYFWMLQSNKIDSLNSQVAQARSEKDSLKNVNQQKEQHEKDIEDLKHRIDVISQIEKGRTIPIHLMDEITKVLDDSLPIWLTSLNFTGQNIMLDGYSFTNPDIANMVKQLEASPYLQNVDLIVSQKATIQGREIFKFSISAGLEMPEEV